MAYPDDIYVQRDLENLPGLEFDSNNKKTLFAEDILRLGREIENIEDVLGLNLSNIEDLINYIVDGKLESKWPIGTAYINFMDGTNPSSLLGFGTWVLDSKGRVLVGKADSGTFNNAGDTMGAETHTLTTQQMPSHTHRFKTGGVAIASTSDGIGIMGATNYLGYGNPGNIIEATGGGGAHNNIQPSLVVYIWRRTA